MSSFKAKLFIDGQERNLLGVSQTFSQYYDVTGRPTNKPIGKSLYFTIESTGDDSYFYHNMFSTSNKVNGEIVFYKRDGFSTLYKIEFAEAHIIGLQENFDHNDNLPLHMSLEVGWSIMKIKGITVKEYWNVNDPWKKVEKTKLEEKEPKIVECYYTDLEGNKQAETQTGEEVYLVVKTQDAVGETIDIDLSNHTKDFIYNDEVIEDDIIKDFEVTADTHKLKLRVIVQQEGKRETIKTS